jgi:hypothetical protein
MIGARPKRDTMTSRFSSSSPCVAVIIWTWLISLGSIKRSSFSSSRFMHQRDLWWPTVLNFRIFIKKYVLCFLSASLKGCIDMICSTEANCGCFNLFEFLENGIPSLGYNSIVESLQFFDFSSRSKVQIFMFPIVTNWCCCTMQ